MFGKRVHFLCVLLNLRKMAFFFIFAKCYWICPDETHKEQFKNVNNSSNKYYKQLVYQFKYPNSYIMWYIVTRQNEYNCEK